MMRRGMLPIIMLPNGDLRIALHLVSFLNFYYLGECSHWGNRGTVAQPTSDENLRYITPGTSLVNEAPPMPLRASSHPGSPNSPSCSALAWYSCWPGLSPWGESGDRTPATRTAVLTRYRYATQPTNIIRYLCCVVWYISHGIFLLCIGPYVFSVMKKTGGASIKSSPT